MLLWVKLTVIWLVLTMISPVKLHTFMANWFLKWKNKTILKDFFYTVIIIYDVLSYKKKRRINKKNYILPILHECLSFQKKKGFPFIECHIIWENILKQTKENWIFLCLICHDILGFKIILISLLLLITVTTAFPFVHRRAPSIFCKIKRLTKTADWQQFNGG